MNVRRARFHRPAALLLAILQACAEPSQLNSVASELPAFPGDPSTFEPNAPIHSPQTIALPAIDPAWNSPSIPPAVRSSISSNERVLRVLPTKFESSGEEVFRLVVLNEQTGEIRKDILTATGSHEDWDALVTADAKARFATNGNVSTRLLNELLPLSQAQVVPIMVHYRMPAPPQPPTTWSPQTQSQHVVQVQALVKAYGDLMEVEIQKSGGVVTWRDPYGPFLIAQLKKQDILAALATHSAVQSLHSTRDEFQPAGMQSTVDLKIDTAFHQNPSSPVWTGAGVRVGINEHSFCPTRTDHPYWEFWGNNNIVFQSSSTYNCTTNADCQQTGNPCGDSANSCHNGHCYSDHGQMVVGEVGSHNTGLDSGPPGYRGAYHAYIHYANGTSSREQWLVGQGVRIMNSSTDGNSYQLTYFNNVYGLSNMGSSMNDPNKEVADHRLASITVGGYQTVPAYPQYASSWSIWPYSSWKNPANCAHHTGCDREYPHVVAHVTPESTCSYPGMTVCFVPGTSFAAPQITGLAALMEQRWYGWFFAEPEAIKATMMTSATLDIDIVPNKPYSDYLSPDEKDGAGVPNSQKIEEMANTSRIIKKHQLPSDYNLPDHRHHWQSVYLYQWQRIRATLAVSSCQDTDLWGDSPHADLDLHIRSGYGSCDGTLMAHGSSYDSEYEITEFTAQGTGWYSICTKYYSWNNDCSGLGPYLRASLAYNWL